MNSTNYMIQTELKKGIKNANAVMCKLRPTLIKANHHRLEVAREKRQKREKIVKKRKIEAMAAK